MKMYGPWDLAGGGFEVGWVDEEGGNGSIPNGSHILQVMGGSPKGPYASIQLIGQDSNCSYGYLGGLQAVLINPIPD